MRIATNKLSDLYKFWQAELSLIYDNDELQAIFELVCEHYLNFSKADVKSKFDSNLNQSDVLKIYDSAKALKTGKPIQYILGEAHFYGLTFRVTPATLIPRPETEELVDLVIKQHQVTKPETLNILDIGTGSGCIPITLKKRLPEFMVTGIDISEEALEIAKYNTLKNNVIVKFEKIDILSESQILQLNSKFSVIVSNPPYVLKSEAKQMDERVLSHEPHLALFVEDNDPILFYKRIIDFCGTHLEKNGCLYFELNPPYAEVVKNYAIESNLFNFTELIKDMSGKWRFLKAQKK